MVISKTSEYALRAVVYLAREPSVSRTGREIADATQVPPDYLTKTLQRLADQGVVNVRRGNGGGYQLARSADELSVLDVVLIVEPSLRLKGCPLELPEHAGELCPLHRRLDEAAAAVEQAFRDTRISELVPQAQESRASSDCAPCTFPAGARQAK